MSLPFDISEKLKSVQVRHYVEWLGRDSHCGYGFAFGYDEKSYRLIDELFQMLQDVETDDEDGAKELWLCARRGTIDDFAKQYGTYEENLEDGTVKNQKEYEDYWKSEFPDEVEWYRFVAVEHTDIKYRCVFLSNKQVLEMDKRLESGYTHDISEFTEWLVDAVKLTIEAVRNGTYNESVARLLPYKHRTGVITRAGLWKLYPEEKESFFEALTQEDVDEFLATGTEDCTGLPELKEMTANDFYRFCALGYAANNYDGQAFALKAQYYRHADGRDDGLKKIDPDSAEAFADWLENREKGGHPWEVCRGGNSTHVSLYVGLGRVAEGCYHLALAAKSYGRCVEAIKFYLALKHAGLPVIIYTYAATEMTLRRFTSRGDATFHFFYDYGDGWEVVLRLEEVFEDSELPGKELPRVLEGQGFGIIEDCGGPAGLEHLREVFQQKSSPEYQSMREWLGTSEVDLSVFDLQDLNFRLKKLPRIFRDLYEYDYPPTKHSIDLLDRKYCKTN